MTPLSWATLALAALYWSHAITATNGPGGVFAAIRKHDRTGVTACLWCACLWVAVALYALYTLTPFGWLVDVSAVAGTAMAVYAWVGVRHM